MFGELKIKHIVYPVSGEKKDPNELLQKSPGELKQNIQSARLEFFKQTTPFCKIHGVVL